MSEMRTKDEIRKMEERASKSACGPSELTRMTYEQGVRDALRWALGDEAYRDGLYLSGEYEGSD